jgi:glycerophosphoryl diester phosphodiesterase
MKLKILTSLALYSSTSYFFLLNPHYLHDCSPRSKRLRLPDLPPDQARHVIAHRGGSMESPENTLQGFKQAVSHTFNNTHIGP